jgi:AmpD protein
MMITIDAKQQWLEPVKRLPSPNCDARPVGTVIDLLVIHNISLPPGEFGGGYIDQLFTNCLDPDEHDYFSEVACLRVSSHLLIDRRGNITQFVPFHRRAWHAGESEFCGCTSCNDFSIGIELEGCDEDPYTTEQYQTLALTTRLLQEQWQGIKKDRIVGHSEIAPGRKTDPGPAFDWDLYFSLVDK